MSGFEATLASEGLSHEQTNINLQSSSTKSQGFNKYAKLPMIKIKTSAIQNIYFDQLNTFFQSKFTSFDGSMLLFDI